MKRNRYVCFIWYHLLLYTFSMFFVRFTMSSHSKNAEFFSVFETGIVLKIFQKSSFSRVFSLERSHIDNLDSYQLRINAETSVLFYLDLECPVLYPADFCKGNLRISSLRYSIIKSSIKFKQISNVKLSMKWRCCTSMKKDDIRDVELAINIFPGF